MRNKSSILATLSAWSDGSAHAGRDAVRQLLLDCGYSIRAPADYPTALLCHRDGWPRFSFMTYEDAVPVGQLQLLANALIPLVTEESES